MAPLKVDFENLANGGDVLLDGVFRSHELVVLLSGKLPVVSQIDLAFGISTYDVRVNSRKRITG